MMTPIKQNNAYPLITVLLDKQGDFQTGETITYEVRKSSDNSLVTSGTLTSTGNIYTDSIVLSDLGEYHILYFTPTKFENGVEKVIVYKSDFNDIQDSLDALAVNLIKVLGLVQSNYRLSDFVYDSNNCLTSGKISIYNTADDTDEDLNPIVEYLINAEYDSLQRLTDYKVTEI